MKNQLIKRINNIVSEVENTDEAHLNYSELHIILLNLQTVKQLVQDDKFVYSNHTVSYIDKQQQKVKELLSN